MSTLSATSHDEREAKLTAEPGWALPSLAGTAGIERVEEGARQVLDAVYFDTPDLRLIRSGITLRFRRDRNGANGSGAGVAPPAGGGPEHAWTLKLPAGGSGDGPSPSLARRELVWPGDPDSPPAEAISLIRATARRAPLRPVARLRTDRRRFRLFGPPGTTDRSIAEIDDDWVTLEEVAGRAPAPEGLAFREVEIELAPETPEGALEAIVDRLESAGATGSVPVPKVVRALGPAALEPPPFRVDALQEASSLGELVAGVIGEAVTTVLRFDPALRLGGDPENLHKVRVALRRLRSLLRTFRPVLDDGWLAEVEPNLRWIGRMLGAVRDADVLAAALAAEVGTLGPADAPAGHDLVGRLAAEREEANRSLLAALDSDGYVELLDRLVLASADPPLARPRSAEVSAAEVLPALVARRWKRVRRQVERLGDDPPDEWLHEARKRAKHLRYAAEAAAPVVGSPAAKLAKVAEGLQDVLGEQHDAVVLTGYLRAAVAQAEPAQALVAGELVARSVAVAERCRHTWRAAWRKVAKKKRRAWLKGASLKGVTAKGVTAKGDALTGATLTGASLSPSG
ncbi:MAG TPA: CYTH and CHAD domain-containing protein [Actinomycetota bacterium]|nr:CYTH and CHAD domain-containing protein [Actinomycetota bacterium]